MYGVVKKVIESKKFELADMLNKIDTLWVQGSLDDEKRAELILLARGNAQAGNSVDLLAKVEELDRRVKLLEEKLSDKESTEEGEESEEPAEVTYPKYEAGKWYYAGDIVSFEGVDYKCVAPAGVVCVWSPSGYPNYWENYSGDSLSIDFENGEPLT